MTLAEVHAKLDQLTAAIQVTGTLTQGALTLIADLRQQLADLPTGGISEADLNPLGAKLSDIQGMVEAIQAPLRTI